MAPTYACALTGPPPVPSPRNTPAAAAIRQLRLEAGLTQAELAEKIGTSQNTISRLELAGSVPTLRTLLRRVVLTFVPL